MKLVVRKAVLMSSEYDQVAAFSLSNANDHRDRTTDLDLKSDLDVIGQFAQALEPNPAALKHLRIPIEFVAIAVLLDATLRGNDVEDDQLGWFTARDAAREQECLLAVRGEVRGMQDRVHVLLPIWNAANPKALLQEIRKPMPHPVFSPTEGTQALGAETA